MACYTPVDHAQISIGGPRSSATQAGATKTSSLTSKSQNPSTIHHFQSTTLRDPRPIVFTTPSMTHSSQSTMAPRDPGTFHTSTFSAPAKDSSALTKPRACPATWTSMESHLWVCSGTKCSISPMLSVTAFRARTWARIRTGLTSASC